jgi:hypothetical protein
VEDNIPEDDNNHSELFSDHDEQGWCWECTDREYEDIREDSHYGDYESEDDYQIDGVGFADPGGNSALRAATEDNPRNLPCPKCRTKNVLTPIDKAHGYVCNACADRAERGYDY